MFTHNQYHVPAWPIPLPLGPPDFLPCKWRSCTNIYVHQRQNAGDLQIWSTSLGTSDPMRWCPYWALECAFVYQRCPGVVTCSFTNHDPRLPTYDPSASGNSRSFLSCRFCNVGGISKLHLPPMVRVITYV